jgi:uncharacterized protein YdaU (DUF1376 family)
MAKNPAFQMYAADFLTDTSHWEADEVGVYTRLLLTQWINGNLPADMNRLARIAGTSVDVMTKIWLVIGCKFVDDGNGNLINPRLEKSRSDKEAYLRLQSEKGKKSAAARKNKRKINRGSNSVETETPTESQPLEDEVEIEVEIEIENDFEKSEKLFDDTGEKPNKAKEKQEIVLPFDSSEFTEHWQWWRKYKREQFGFKYKSQVTEQAAVNDLVKIAKGDEVMAIEIIRQSIANGWKGFFPLKAETDNGAQLQQPVKKGVFQANLEANIGAKKLLRRMYENGAFDHYKQG